MTTATAPIEVEALKARVGELEGECDQVRAFWKQEYERLLILYRLAVHTVRELRERP